MTCIVQGVSNSSGFIKSCGLQSKRFKKTTLNLNPQCNRNYYNRLNRNGLNTENIQFSNESTSTSRVLVNGQTIINIGLGKVIMNDEKKSQLEEGHSKQGRLRHKNERGQDLQRALPPQEEKIFGILQEVSFPFRSRCPDEKHLILTTWRNSAFCNACPPRYSDLTTLHYFEKQSF